MYLCITGLFTGYMTLVYSGYLKFVDKYLLFIWCSNAIMKKGQVTNA